MKLCKIGRSILAGIVACILAAAIIMIQRDDGIVFHAPDGSPVPFNKAQFVAAHRPTVGAPAEANAQIDAANAKTYYVRETIQQVEDMLK